MFTILCLGFALSVFSQEPKVYFDDALSEHLRTYNSKSDLAVKNKNIERVDILFDSLIQLHLKNTYVANLKLKKTTGGYINTDAIEKPFLIITKKSCFIQKQEEIKAINEIANQYKGKVEVIVLYWDKRHVAKKIARQYNKNISVVYIDERKNKLNNALSAYKHSFGVPTCFYVTENKQISSIDRKFYLKNIKSSTKKLFFENAYNGITQLMFKNETQNKGTITNNVNN